MVAVNPTPEYHVEAEQHFLRRVAENGPAQLCLNPREFAMLDFWFCRDVSLPCVMRGIDLAFEEHKRSRSRRPITSLMYCKRFVEDLAAKFPKVRNQEEPCPKLNLNTNQTMTPQSLSGSRGVNSASTPDTSTVNAEETSASAKITESTHVLIANEHPTWPRSQASRIPIDRGENQAPVRPGMVETTAAGAPRRDLPGVQPAPKREIATPEDWAEFWATVRKFTEVK